MSAAIRETLAAALALIDDENGQARSDLQCWADWFDVDLEIGAEPTKKSRPNRVGRRLISACSDRGRYRLGCDLYLLLGLAAQMEGLPIDKLSAKRDIKAVRRMVSDFPGRPLPSVVEALSPGKFADWWMEPVDPPPRPQPDALAVAETLARVRALNWEGRESLEDLDDSEDPWIAPFVARGTEIIDPLLTEIREGTPHSATAAAAMLHTAVRRQRRDLPLPWVAIPLLDLLDEGSEVVTRNRGIDPTRWPLGEQKWRTDQCAAQIMPRGDLYEWVFSHAGEYGNRLEGTLVDRTQTKLAQLINPHEPWLLADLPVFHQQLSHATHQALGAIVEHIAQEPEYYDGWLDADRIADPYRYSKFPHGKPAGWARFCTRLSKPFPE